MSSRTSLGLTAVALTLFAAACERDLDLLGLAPFPSDPVVFADAPGSTVDWFPFAGSKPDVFTVDDSDARVGAASLRITVPIPSDPTGSYAGGVVGASVPRDLSSYNALTFWAKASQPITLNVAGFGNDNSGNSVYPAEISGGLPLSTAWAKYTLPMPDPSVLTEEAGLFFFAEGAEGTTGYDIWFDEVQYESLNTLANPRPSIGTETVTAAVGATFPVPGTQYTVDVSGVDVTMNAAAAYFDFASSDPAVATVDENGTITLLAAGTADITASLGSTAASGTVTLNVTAPPSEAAPTPTQDAADVISIYSNAYTDRPVDSWLSFGNDGVSYVDGTVLGDDVKIYSNLVFAGIEFTSQTIDISGMTNFHIDMWTPDDVTSGTFTVGLVDFGADNAFGGDDDSRHDIVINASTSPALTTGTWVSIDVPTSSFTGLSGTGNLAQIILVGGPPSTVYLDNIYFYDDGGSTGGGGDPMPPTAPAPAPTQAAGDVISIYSDSYTDNARDGFNFYGAAAFEEVDIAGSGNSALRYTRTMDPGGNFQVLELGGANQIDASGMTNFRFDLYFPNPIEATDQFLLKLVDIGAATTEAQIFVNNASTPALAQGAWLSFDFPFASLTSLTGTANIQQVVFDLLSENDAGEVFVDNIYFYDSAGSPSGPTPPTAPAPAPTEDAADVISIYSDSYTDVPRENLAAYGAAAFEEFDVGGTGNTALHYTRTSDPGGNFQVLELGGGNQIDATGMTNFRFDVWFPNPIVANEQFLVKLVDIGAATSEELWFINGSSTPAIAAGTWLSFDYVLADVATLAGTANIQQVVFDILSENDVLEAYIDNIYFYNAGGSSGPTPPAAPAATPTEAAADVISIYSDAYTDVPRENLAAYGAAAFEEFDVGGTGNTALHYTRTSDPGGNFQVLELGGGNQIDATGMTNFRFDVYFPNAITANEQFLVKLVDIGAATSEELWFINGSSTPAIAAGTWLSFDYVLADVATLAGTANIQQVVFDILSENDVLEAYIDNIYFYR
ncbi:MAG: Ig-like domain-containing protein [Gemmatimonadota bacterium]